MALNSGRGRGGHRLGIQTLCAMHYVIPDRTAAVGRYDLTGIQGRARISVINGCGRGVARQEGSGCYGEQERYGEEGLEMHFVGRESKRSGRWSCSKGNRGQNLLLLVVMTEGVSSKNPGARLLPQNSSEALH